MFSYMNTFEEDFNTEKMNSSLETTISLKKVLEELRLHKVPKTLEVLRRCTVELMGEDDNMIEFQESDYEEILNECTECVSNYIFQLPENKVEEHIILKSFLFLCFVKKLNMSKKEKLGSNDLRLRIINDGLKLIRLCVDKENFVNVDYYLYRILRELDALENYCREEKTSNNQIIYKRVELTMLNIEIMMKQNKLVEAMEELNRQKDRILQLKIYQDYFVGICYNIALKCNQDENYDYALTVLLLAYDVCKAADHLSKNMKTTLHFLVCICLKHNPNKNWEHAIKALNLTNKNCIETFYIIGKIKFALITQQRNLLEEILNEAAEWEYINYRDINQIVQLLQKNDLSVLAAEFIQTVRYKPLPVNDKFLLMKLEIQIYIAANDRKVFSLLDNSIDFIRKNNTDAALTLSLYKLVLSHATFNFKEKMFKNSLTWYTYCAQICEVGGLNMSFLQHVQMRICLCYIEGDDWDSAKQTFEKQKANFDEADPLYVYLALQIAFVNDDRKLAEEVLNRCDGDSKIGDVLLSCCHRALSSGKKDVLFKILEAILTNYHTTGRNVLVAKLSQYLIGLCSCSTGENINIQEKNMLYMDKALTVLQQNPDHEETSELSQWFSRAAWNLALTPDIEPKYMFEFFLRCCCFSEISSRHHHRLKNALMLAAASGLHVVRKMNPKENSERDDIIRKVMTVIEKCKSLETGTNVTLLRLLYLYEFEARCHLNQWDDGNGAGMEVLHLPFMDVKTLGHIAAIVNEFSPHKYEIILESLKAAVQKISESEDHENSEASKTYHSLIQVLFYVQEYLSPSVEEENLTFCSNLLTLIERKTLKNYPQLEILWLMIKCWNWGVQKLTLNDTKRAYKWCSLAMAFLQKLESLKTLHEKKLNGMYAAYFPSSKDDKESLDCYLE